MPELEGPTIDPDRFRDEDDPYPDIGAPTRATLEKAIG